MAALCIDTNLDTLRPRFCYRTYCLQRDLYRHLHKGIFLIDMIEM